ncbi:MAG: DNA/RNA nuclease SfsA [Alphaproteobacteria bacterium]|nr:DNA/RNA nuclease SfsA [Alphaproteobacteria bacterium]
MRLPPLHGGVLLRRYKRFLADVRLDDGQEVTAHCANPGAMTGCATPGWRAALTHHPDPKRKLKWSLQLVFGGDDGDVPILVNTALPNAIAAEGVAAGVVPGLAGYPQQRAEVRYGDERSRIDLLLSAEGRPDCYVEVKNVTLRVGPGEGAFPDAVSKRATKHLRELVRVVEAGDRAALLFLVSRGDVARVRPAEEIDPAYAAALREAAAAGVEVFAHRVDIAPPELTLGDAVPVLM